MKKTKSNLLQVYEEGSVKSGEESLGIWQSLSLQRSRDGMMKWARRQVAHK